MYKIFSFLRKITKFADLQNAVILQPLDGFLCPTPEMKARDAYVSFLAYKSENKSRINNFIFFLLLPFSGNAVPY